MPITNITHSAYYTVEIGVSAEDLTRITLDNIHTAYKHICLQGTGCVSVKNYPPEIMQPSSSMRETIVSAENQNGATIVKATFFFRHYYIAWEPNNAGEARGQSWDESLKSRWIPGGSCGYTSGTPQMVSDCSVYHARPIPNISWKSVHAFFRNVVQRHTNKQDRQTDRQTITDTNQMRWKHNLRRSAGVINYSIVYTDWNGTGTTNVIADGHKRRLAYHRVGKI